MSPLPPLTSQVLVLQVFSHKSLLGSTPAAEGDNDRLSEMGLSALQMAVTASLFAKRPILSGKEIETQRLDFFTEPNITQIVDVPELWGHLRFGTLEAKEKARTYEEMKNLLCAYMGAVYSTTGISSIQLWVNQIISPGGSSQEFAYNRVSSITPLGATAPPTHEFPTAMPPPSGAPILAMFNQTCAQRGIIVSWNGNSVGPSHAPRWTMECLMDGQIKGAASGRNQKLAKEAAARDAWVAAGFGPLQ